MHGQPWHKTQPHTWLPNQFPRHVYMDDLKAESSFDSQADVLGLVFDMDICTTRNWLTSGRQMQDLNIRTVRVNLKKSLKKPKQFNKDFLSIFSFYFFKLVSMFWW